MAASTVSDYLKKAERAFEDAAAVPAIKSATVENETQFTVVFSQASVAEGKTVNYAATFTEDPAAPETDRRQPGFTRTMPQTLAENTLQATRGGVRVELLKTKSEKGDEIEVVRVFRGGRMAKSVNLTDLDLHGKVYFDEEFGGLSISPDLRAAAFVAEEKKPKNRPYLKATAAAAAADEFPDDGKKELRGQENLFREEFGEQMVGKSSPVIAQLDLSDYALKVRDGVPEGWAPGQVAFAGDGALVGIATETAPRRLGIVYCSNRKGALFRLDAEGRFEVLRGSPDLGVPQSPRVSPGGKWLVWLERDLRREKGLYPGPHATCLRLMKLDLGAEAAVPKEVVPVVEDGRREFLGLYGNSLPRRPFSSCGRYLLLTTYRKCDARPVLCDLEADTFDYVASPDRFGSLSVADVHLDRVLAVLAAPNRAPTVLRCRLNTGDGVSAAERVSFKLPDSDAPLPGDIACRYIEVKAKKSHPEGEKYGHVASSAILMCPESPEKLPLVLWPHGGPHSAVMSTFMSQAYFFNLLGYAVLFVNYRGSLGAGTDSVASIMGNVGDTDVEDCRAALERCLEEHPGRVASDHVYLMGGSHGGFLVTHLVGQYPDMFK